MSAFSSPESLTLEVLSLEHGRTTWLRVNGAVLGQKDSPPRGEWVVPWSTARTLRASCSMAEWLRRMLLRHSPIGRFSTMMRYGCWAKPLARMGQRTRSLIPRHHPKDLRVDRLGDFTIDP